MVCPNKVGRYPKAKINSVAKKAVTHVQSPIGEVSDVSNSPNSDINVSKIESVIMKSLGLKSRLTTGYISIMKNDENIDIESSPF